MASTDRSPRSLRRDAVANRERILAAAARLMAERGLEVGHHEIAQAAGVAVGTVYRRFPDKSSLVDALFRQQVDAATAAARAALDIVDPWQGLAQFLGEVVERQARSQGLRELAAGSVHGAELAAYARGQVAPAVAELLARAQRAGVVRADVTEQDLALVPIMVGAVVNASRGIDRGTWSRCLALVLDGLRAVDRPPLPGASPASAEMARILGG